MSIGLKRGMVRLEPHNEQWESIAGETIHILKRILGEDAIDIQHVRSHHIHVVIWKQEAWMNYINFKEYLNEHEDEAVKYQVLKENLQKEYANDRAAYTKGKAEMIDHILRRANIWAKVRGRTCTNVVYEKKL